MLLMTTSSIFRLAPQCTSFLDELLIPGLRITICDQIEDIRITPQQMKTLEEQRDRKQAHILRAS